MIAKLISANANDIASEISLPSFPVTIGRGLQVDIQVPDQWTSRQHCRIVRAETQLVVQDLGSTYGTFVNGQAIVEATLNHGDTLTVGISNFQVHLKDREPASVFELVSVSWKKLRSKIWNPPANPAASRDSANNDQAAAAAAGNLLEPVLQTHCEEFSAETSISPDAEDSALTETNTASHEGALNSCPCC